MAQNIIQQRVILARQGKHPQVVGRMPSGWLFMADTQPVAGYCILMADPIVPSINDLAGQDRAAYLADVVRVGDALLGATQAARINYETWCNQEPSLHTHIVPRYREEADAQRIRPLCVAYDIAHARPFDAQVDGPLMHALRAILGIAPAQPPLTGPEI